MARKLFTILQLYAVAMVFMNVSASPSYDFTASSADGENGHATSEPEEMGNWTWSPSTQKKLRGSTTALEEVEFTS